jgi:hypothetical protein
MQTHIKVVAWLYILLGLLGIFAALLIFAAVFGGGLISGDRTAIAITGLVATLISSVVVVTSLPGLIAGLGLLRYKGWARILGLVLGVLNLPAFPLGTLLGLYTLYALLEPNSDLVFQPQYTHPVE